MVTICQPKLPKMILIKIFCDSINAYNHNILNVKTTLGKIRRFTTWVLKFQVNKFSNSTQEKSMLIQFYYFINLALISPISTLGKSL